MPDAAPLVTAGGWFIPAGLAYDLETPATHILAPLTIPEVSVSRVPNYFPAIGSPEWEQAQAARRVQDDLKRMVARQVRGITEAQDAAIGAAILAADAHGWEVHVYRPAYGVPWPGSRFVGIALRPGRRYGEARAVLLVEHRDHDATWDDDEDWALPLHRTEAGYPSCSTCDGGGCPDCTDPA